MGDPCGRPHGSHENGISISSMPTHTGAAHRDSQTAGDFENPAGSGNIYMSKISHYYTGLTGSFPRTRKPLRDTKNNI
jgi:hypothetical protein